MPPFPSELIDQFSRGNGCVFVGAGLSRGAGLPNWADLVKPLAARVKDCPPDSSFLDIAQYYENQEGRGGLIRYLQEALRGKDVRPTAAHRLLVTLPVQRIFTTNFDSLLEAACSEAGVDCLKVLNALHLPLLDSTRKALVKLHGELDLPETIVLTAYNFESYFSDHPGIADLLKIDLQTRTVLFLGYSFNDFDLRTILSQVSRESRELRRNLFSVQLNPPPVVTKDLERRGVTVIPLKVTRKGHETEALQAWLEDLVRRIGKKKDPQPPTSVIKVLNNNLPRRQAGELLGRKDNFNRVMEGLRSRYPLIAIEGFAGVGKTSLAVEVGHACLTSPGQDDSGAVVFDYVVWISAKDRPEQKRWLGDVLNVTAKTLSFPAITQRPVEERKPEVEALLRTYKVLLIIDNFETMNDPDLVTWLEQVPEPSKILITTRDTQPQQKAWAVKLQGLGLDESLTMLRQDATDLGLKFIERVSDDTLRALSQATGGNPQAMKLALGLIRDGDVELWSFIEHLQRSNPDQSIDKLFEELFSGSWKRLSEPGRLVLLTTPLFVGVSSLRIDALEAAAHLPKDEFRKALRECTESSLLEMDHDDRDRRVVLHPMTRAFARRQLNERPEWEKEVRHWCSQYFLDLIRRSVCREQPEPRYWNALVTDRMAAIDPEWPSIQEVMKWADQEGNHQLLVELVMLLVHYMDSRFYNSERLSYVSKAVAAVERLGHKEDEALLRIDALGWTYVEEDRLQEAYDEIHRGFEIAEKFAKKGRTDLRALGLAWRARVRIELAEPERAQELIRDALKIRGARPWIKFRVAMAAGDIALKRGDSKNALSYYQNAETEVNKYGGEGHGYQIAPRLGLAYLGLGRLDEARAQFSRLASFDKIAIGKLYADYGLAMVDHQKGNFQSARERLEQVKAELSRRTTSNLLLKLIESQEAKIPGLPEIQPPGKPVARSKKGQVKRARTRA